MRVEIEEKAGVVTPGRIKEYRKNPSSLNLAASAAAQMAKKLGERVIVIEGNSYMRRVYHIAKENESISKYTAKSGSFKVLVVESTGDCFYGIAE